MVILFVATCMGQIPQDCQKVVDIFLFYTEGISLQINPYLARDFISLIYIGF